MLPRPFLTRISSAGNPARPRARGVHQSPNPYRARNRKFESGFLQRRVRCEPELGEGGLAYEIAVAPPGLYLLEDMSALPLRIGPRRYGRTTAEVSEESSRRSRGHVAERVLGFRWSSSPRQQGRAGISGGSSALLQGDQRSNPLSSSSDSARWVSGPASPYRLPNKFTRTTRKRPASRFCRGSTIDTRIYSFSCPQSR